MSQADQIAIRREFVARCLRRGMSQRKIQRELFQEGYSSPSNPEKPISIGTVNRDVQKIRIEWAERRIQSIDDWVSEEIAKLDSLENVLWEKLHALDDIHEIDKMISQIVKVADRRAKLLGLDAPTRMKIGADEGLSDIMGRVADAKERLYLRLENLVDSRRTEEPD
jgi:hypothetical protein